MGDDVRARVDARWAALGILLAAARGDGGAGPARRRGRLRRPPADALEGAHGRRAGGDGHPGSCGRTLPSARRLAPGRPRPAAPGRPPASRTPSASGSSPATPTRWAAAVLGALRRLRPLSRASRRGRTGRRGGRRRPARRLVGLTDASPPSPRPGLVELRASLVIGAGSPTFELLRRLADRLPVLPLPRYAERRLQPLAAGDMVSCLVAACDGAEDGRSYALVGPDTLAVRDMLAQVGALLGRRPSRLAMPFDAPGAASLVRCLARHRRPVGADRARGP